MRDITEAQFLALQAIHGDVFVLTAGEAGDFAFRVPTDNDVDLAVTGREEKRYNFHEEEALNCLLTPDAPEVGIGPKQDLKCSKEAQALLVAEKMRLQGLWKDAPCTGDDIGYNFARMCGARHIIKSESTGGGHYVVKVTQDQDTLSVDSGIDLDIAARKMTTREYAEYRRLTITASSTAAARYAYAVCVESPDKAVIARRYPHLVIDLSHFLQVLGGEGKAVSAKKYQGGSAKPPGDTTAQPVSEAT